MKILSLCLALLLSSQAVLAHPCQPKKKRGPTPIPTRVTPKPCQPDTIRVTEKRNTGPWIALAGGLIAGAILVHANQDRDCRVYVTNQPPKDNCKGGKKH